MKVCAHKAEQTIAVKLGTYARPTAEAGRRPTTEPEEPKDLGGNVDLEQLGLTVSPAPARTAAS